MSSKTFFIAIKRFRNKRMLKRLELTLFFVLFYFLFCLHFYQDFLLGSIICNPR